MTRPGMEAAPPLPKHWAWWAFLWGLAEATFFFVVPDVFTSRLALQDFRRALVACVVAVAGTLVGGTLLWLVCDYDVGPRLLRSYTHLPGINGDLVASTGQAVLQHGANALFSGTLRIQPYKLFAAHAGVQSVSLPMFLVVSAGVRLAGSVFIAALGWLLARTLQGHSPKVLFQLHTLVWLAAYLLYFLLMF